MQDRVLLEIRHVMPDGFGNVGHQAFDLQFADDLLKYAAFGFALGRALQFQWHGDLHLFIEAHAGEVHVNHFDAEVIVLDFLHQHLFALAVEGDIEQMSAVTEVAGQLLFHKCDGKTASLWP